MSIKQRPIPNKEKYQSYCKEIIRYDLMISYLTKNNMNPLHINNYEKCKNSMIKNMLKEII